MALSTQEISDRIEINDLLIRYTRAIDTKDYELLDSCFTPDAHVDYTSAGGIAGDYPKVRAWLEAALAPFPVTVHALANSVVEIDGERIEVVTEGEYIAAGSNVRVVAMDRRRYFARLDALPEPSTD